MAQGAQNQLMFIIEKYEKKIYHLAYLYMDNHQLAEKVVQEVFLKAMQKKYLDHLTLLRLTVITCKKILKQSWYSPELTASTSIKTPQQINDEQDQIYHYITSLPSKYKDIILLAHGYGLTQTEIAKVLKLPEKLVAYRLNQGTKKLTEMREYRNGSENKTCT